MTALSKELQNWEQLLRATIPKEKKAVADYIVALIADQCRLARLDELRWIPAHPKYMDYISDRIRELEEEA
jgi:hypothetical protein